MLKRAIDILLSTIAIMILLPFMIIISVIVYFNLGYPIFFIQERPGLNGKIFKIIKFRSMLNPTSKNGKLLLEKERLTKFGKVLRSTSLDELPELINVLKGDMSLVGPRPLLVEYLPLYNERQSKRHNIRPGITGWAQVNGRNAISWEKKFELDVWYLENQSLLLDFKIIFMTVGKVFKRVGINQDDSVTMEDFTGTKFLVVDFSDKEIWDSLIGEDADIYYKWQYVDAFKVNGDGQPFLAYYESGNSKLYNVFFKRHINDSLYYDITTPYGYGGIVLIGEENIVKEYQLLFDEYCIKSNIICEFVRLNPLSNNFKYYLDTDYECIKLSTTVYVQLESEAQIWDNFKSECRNRIRKAGNNGIEIKSGFNSKFMDEFKNIYYQTMKRDSGTDYYFFEDGFFDSILKNLNKNAKIYTAYYNDKPISSILILFSGKNAHYHLGGSLYDYMKLGANNILFYSAACDLLNMGYSKLHLGGGYGGQDSTLLRYKKSFNPKGMVDFYICKRVYDIDVYNHLIDLRKSDDKFDLNSSYFPLYRQ